MVCFKIALLVLAALGAVQGHVVAKRATFNPLSFLVSRDSAMLSALTIVKTSSREMTFAINEATAKLTSYIKMARAAQASAQANAEAQIRAIAANATALAATQSGSEACLTQAAGDVKALGAQTLLNVVNCLGKKITELENMLQTVVDTGNLAFTMAPVAISKIIECHEKRDLFEIFCHGTAALAYVGKVNTVIAQVAGVVTGATEFVSTLQTDLASCVVVQIAGMPGEAAKVVVNVAICTGRSFG